MPYDQYAALGNMAQGIVPLAFQKLFPKGAFHVVMSTSTRDRRRSTLRTEPGGTRPGSRLAHRLRAKLAAFPQIEPSMAKIVRARALLRISSAGGGTDISPYPEERGGAVLSATINKYAYASLVAQDNGEIRVRSLDYDIVANTTSTATSATTENWTS